MRIVGGTWGGRQLQAPPGTGTRPTSDRVREAMFSALEARGAVIGARVLDAFAGTGALGLEALSRGALSAAFVEKDVRALAALRGNIAALGASTRTVVVPGDIRVAAIRAGRSHGPFSLLFLDPPYRIDKSEVRGLIESLLSGGMLRPDALIVWEHAGGEEPEWPAGVSRILDKRYGDTAVSMAVVGQMPGEGQ